LLDLRTILPKDKNYIINTIKEIAKWKI
jgi:pyruvate/2-oxoglutarate/acetoin dehydrogenase E1 component